MDRHVHPFLGSSVTGSEIAAHDWSRSSLGPIEAWPSSLVALVRTMLACPTPMFLAWGPDLLCFYNDAYRPILGYRLASALGRPFQDVWSSIWNDILPLVEETLAGGSRTMNDMKLDLSRAGEPEESYWTFTYSPAFDDAGEIAGLFCVTGETTARVVAERDRDAADDRLKLALSASNTVGTWDWDVVRDEVRADRRFALLYGVDADKAREGAPIAEFFGSIHPDDRARVEAAVAAAMASKRSFHEEYRLVQPDGGVRWVIAEGRALYDADGRCVRFPGVSFDITGPKATEEALRRSEERLRGITNSIDQMIWSTLPDGYHDYYNDRWYEFTGVPHGSTDGEAWNGMFHLEDQERAWTVWRECLATGQPYHIEYRLRHRSGEYRWVLGRAKPVFDEAGRITRWFGTCTDIQEIVDAREVLARSREELEAAIESRTAELIAAEEQLRQAQKMEAVGQLTGGLAHDFNNLLAGISGSLELINTRLHQGRITELDKYVVAAQGASKRAAALTHRLLAFSRRQTLSPKATNVNALVTGMIDLVRRTVGPAIAIEHVGASGLWPALVDGPQLENALLNLCINARDAMPEGGRITIETGNRWIDRYAARNHDMPEGQYLSLCVSDTGTGMTPDVIAKAFDPFFTTKPIGEGTGLGLSMIYGFAKQSGGQVRIYSELGQGTMVCIYLPRHFGNAELLDTGPESSEGLKAGTGETVLVVDDEPTVRMLITDVLEDLGYTAIEAADSASGLRILESIAQIDLLITDVGLPGGMNGRQMADAARQHRPDLKVLFITGFAENALLNNGHLEPGMTVLTKPFAVDTMAARIREMIAG